MTKIFLAKCNLDTNNFVLSIPCILRYLLKPFFYFSHISCALSMGSHLITISLKKDHTERLNELSLREALSSD